MFLLDLPHIHGVHLPDTHWTHTNNDSLCTYNVQKLYSDDAIDKGADSTEISIYLICALTFNVDENWFTISAATVVTLIKCANGNIVNVQQYINTYKWVALPKTILKCSFENVCLMESCFQFFHCVLIRIPLIWIDFFWKIRFCFTTNL